MEQFVTYLRAELRKLGDEGDEGNIPEVRSHEPRGVDGSDED
jgi:hypothetical protein